MSSVPAPVRFYVRNTQRGDFDQIGQMCREVYTAIPPWGPQQLESHLRVFPEGQLVAVETGTQRVVGMAASLIVLWDDYHVETNWRDFTDGGMFTNHDPEHGRTLYGADVMVRPGVQGKGIGKMLYQARRDLVKRLGLLRIRAGARLRNYHKYAAAMSAQEYVHKVISGELGDPTLSFQLKQGFRVLAVVSGYLSYDPESLGHAAVIEWLNHEVARRRDMYGRDPRYARRRGRRLLPEPADETSAMGVPDPTAGRGDRGAD